MSTSGCRLVLGACIHGDDEEEEDGGNKDETEEEEDACMATMTVRMRRRMHAWRRRG